MFLSIDPGVTGTGIAFWTEDHFDRTSSLDWAESILPGRRVHWENKVADVMASLRDKTYRMLPFRSNSGVRFLDPGDVTSVWIEQPKFFDDSALGHSVAKTGDLIKLCVMVGCIYEWFRGKSTPNVHLVPVDMWKGQLPKKVVEGRIRRAIPNVEDLIRGPKATHAWDAIGIGLWAKEHGEKWLKEKTRDTGAGTG